MTHDTISHYRVLDKLGEGGMGSVFRAVDTRLGRTVAIKVVNAAFTQRFEREARAIAALNHPHICTLYDVGEHGGAPFLVMEFVEGKPLRGPLPVDEALGYSIQIAHALAAAHKAGIVHRDLKPDNILLTAEGSVKILDFGLAKLHQTAPEALKLTTMTEQGAIAGTGPYMSPEQAQGEAVDARSDIFSFGAVLYELLSGRRAFARETFQATLVAVVAMEPEPLREAPPTVARIVSKMLAKEREKRYQSAGELLKDLEAAAREKPWWQTRRALVGMAATPVALAGAALGFNVRGWRSQLMDWMAPPAARAIRLAVLPFVNMTGDPEQEYFSDGLTENLIASLAKIGALRVTSRTSVMRYKRTEKSLREIANDLGVDTLIEGSAQQSKDRVRVTAQLIDGKTDEHLWANTYDRPIAEAFGLASEVAREIARRIKVTVTPEQETRLTSARKVDPKVYEAYLRGKFYVSQRTPEGFEKGMKLLHEAVAIDPAEPLGYIGLAEGYITLGHGGAEESDTYTRARAAAEQALKLDPDAAEAIGTLAEVALYHERDWEKAERLFKRALDLNPSLAMTHYHYAWYLALFDRLDEAIAEHKLARDLDPLQALHTGWLGRLYEYAGRYDEAIAEAKKALELNPRFTPSYGIMSRAYSRKGMHEEAIAAAQRQVEMNPQAVPHLAFAYLRAGQREQALALAARRRPDSPPESSWAKLYAALGDRDAAFRELEAAYERHATAFPWIRVHGGGFDFVRDDARFQALLRKMRLPP